jgi:hypothetical protein
MVAVLELMRTAIMHTNRYIPLTALTSATPPLYIDTHADPQDLHDYATQRIQVATDLLESVTCLSLSNTCDRDLPRFANAAYLLLRDGVDVLEVIRTQRVRQAL